MVPAMSLEFWVTSLVITATPGTGVLYTVSTGIARGRSASVAAAVGCTLGIVPHLAAAIFGAAALLRASGVAFDVLKYAGVAYLLYMAWRTIRETGELAVGETAARSPLRIISSAVLINLLNPKLTLFFFAFLPQFVDTHRSGATLQMLEMGGFFMAMTLAIFVVYGLLASAVRDRVLSRPRVTTWLRRVFAGSFVALSARLVVTER
jgi:threonine/homoserine/homoserine lactone efflux protein